MIRIEDRYGFYGMEGGETLWMMKLFCILTVIVNAHYEFSKPLEWTLERVDFTLCKLKNK